MPTTAPSPIPTPQPPTTPQPSLDPTRRPLPLTASQEQQVRELYHKRVRGKCADEVREFARCCTEQGLLATFQCRGAQRLMNSCMLQYATPGEQDAARAEWFATMEQRREERERKEEKRKVDEKFWREWWDKDKEKDKGRDGKGGGKE